MRTAFVAAAGSAGMPPSIGDRAPDFTALYCDGATFRARSLDDALGPRGGVLVPFGFAFSAIAENWWTRYDRRGWDDFDGVPVLGVSRDGPYALNAFARSIDAPFGLFSDVNGDAIDAYGLLVERGGMAGTRTARRATFVLDADRRVRERWIADDWITPPPVADVEAAVGDL